MNDKKPLLAVNNLSVHYATGTGELCAVNDISFSVAAGEIVGLVGESGSGKSTVAQAVLGLLDRQSTAIKGSIEFDGSNVFSYDERRWRTVRGRRIGMIFQSPVSSFNPAMTIGAQMIESLTWHLNLNKSEACKAAYIALKQVGMPRPVEVMRNYAFELSGGMCQRVALALVLALRPALVLADEPTASLDVVAQAELVQWLSLIQKKSSFAMLVISHDMNLIASLADRLLVLYGGYLVEEGDAESVLKNPRQPYTNELINAVPRLVTPKSQCINASTRFTAGKRA